MASYKKPPIPEQKNPFGFAVSGTKRMNPFQGADLADFCVEGLSRENTELYVGGLQILTLMNSFLVGAIPVLFTMISIRPKVRNLPMPAG